VRHLLHHAAGWDPKVIGDPLMHRELPDLNADQTLTLNSVGHIVDFMLKQPLQFTPGVRSSLHEQLRMQLILSF
jgi:hypothetical protein